MSKIDKLRERLNNKPYPKDFTWEEFITLMNHSNFKEACRGGSHYTFQHISGYKHKASKSHPAGLLKKYQIDNAISALIDVDEWK